MRNNIALLRTMVADAARQSDLYKPGPYWRAYERRVRRAIERNGIERFRADEAVGKGFSGPPLRPSQLWSNESGLRAAVKRALRRAPLLSNMFDEIGVINGRLFEQLLAYRSLFFQERFGEWFAEATRGSPLPDGTHAGCENFVELNGGSYAIRYVEMLMHIHNFSKHLDFSKVRTVFEIGGGFGALSHLLLSRYQNIRKLVYLDIPPMIYVGTEYLRHHFGAAVIDYDQTRGSDSLRFAANDDLEILCICPWQIEHLDCSVDLFWNAASFSEMTPEIVANYALHIAKRLTPGDAHVCLILNKVSPVDSHRITMPRDVLGAFGESVAFSEIEPEVENVARSQYHLGTNAGR